MIKTRMIISGLICIVHTILFPLLDTQTKLEIAGDFEKWIIFCGIFFLFCCVFSLLTITAQEKKIIFSHFLNNVGGTLVGCWFVLVVANNLTNNERGFGSSFGISLLYLSVVLFSGFLLGKFIDRFFRKSNL